MKNRTAARLAASAVTAGLSFAGAAALLHGEARAARKRVDRFTPIYDPPTGSGIWGAGDGEPIVFAMMGDSSAVGLGVDDVTETPGVLIAAGLSRLAARPVQLMRMAISGAESRHLDQQVSDVLPYNPEIAVIMIGANDVTARTKPEVASAHLAAAVRRLRSNGVDVVVATCPDLGTVRPIPQPLRLIARKWSRDMAAAQIIAVIKAGGRTVALGSALGPQFARSRELWSDDGYHPSAAGYAAAASFVLPSVADALGYWPISRQEVRDRSVRRRDRLHLGESERTLSTTALRSSHRTGTEVTSDITTSLDGTRRRWTRLKRLLPVALPVPHPGTPPPEEAANPSAPDLIADAADAIRDHTEKKAGEGR